MKNRLQRSESLMWLGIKLILYTLLMGAFVYMFGRESHSLRVLSRTLGITLSTFCIVGLLFIHVYGKYDVGRRKSKPIIYSLILAVLCTDVVTYVQMMIMRTNIQDVRAFKLESIGTLVIVYIIQIITIIIFVYGGNALFFRIHKPERCCVVTGSQESLDAVARVVLKYKKQYQIVRVLDYHKKDLLYCLEDIDTVFMYDVPVALRSEIIHYCYRRKIHIYFNPEVEDIIEMNSEYYVLDDVSLLNANAKALTMEQRIVKRLVDIVLAVVIGVVTCPLWLIAMIAIKCYDGGTILFKQKRATINGRPFTIYKFRTMKEEAEHRVVTENDPRITSPGQFLRRSRIDELPQLINVLKGDMTIVGPRPEAIENVEEYEARMPEFQYRSRVKAGLTGYAQIAGKYNTTPKDKLIMDMMYIENFSIWRDIQLLFQTMVVLLRRDSTEAFRKRKKSVYKFEKEDSDDNH